MAHRIFEDSHGTFHGNAEYQYVNSAGMGIEVLDPQNLYVVAGRATGKTTQIIARRSIRVSKDMPGAYFAFVGDYYSNLLSNTVPSMIKGWNDMGLKEGVHYVVNDRPPSSFAKPYKKPLSYKHTISFYNGCFYKLASMDVVSSMAGDSYQHAFGDEVKYLVKDKLDKLLPALRGENLRFSHSHYYLGKTFTTDMPNVLSVNEYDWILDQEKNMDFEQLKLILHASLEVNKIKQDLLKAYFKKDKLGYERHKRAWYRWNERLKKTRINSTMFLMMSSFANADILKLDWFNEQFKILGPEQFRPAILTMKHEIKHGDKFYPFLDAKHFYDDGLLLEFMYQFDIGDKPIISSDGLKYINTRQKLEAGADFGDMMSMVIGQEQGWVQRVMKNLYTLDKDEKVIAEMFREFFKNHKMKVLDLYYDRSGNANQNTNKDWAGLLKNAIEYEGDKKTNWTVNLMSRGQGTIYHEQEFLMQKLIMSEVNSRLPKLQIDMHQCKELKSSLENAKQKIKIKQETGVKSIHKDKSSEKNLPKERLPMWSTNMSDAFKYYICRPKYMAFLKDKYTIPTAYAPTMH